MSFALDMDESIRAWKRGGCKPGWPCIDLSPKQEDEMAVCSICGAKKAVCVDRKHKGTYWLCGDCAGECIEELIDARTRIEALEKESAEYARLWHRDTARMKALEEALEAARRADKRGEYGIDWDVIAALAAGEK